MRCRLLVYVLLHNHQRVDPLMAIIGSKGTMMWCRFCAAARAAMAWAEPQDPHFFELALQHRYPLRHLSIAELLPVCRLDSYLAKVGAG
jgi:hypothetical protein